MADRTPLHELSYEGKQVFYDNIALVFQSCFYGVHAALIPFAVAILLSRRKQSSRNLYLLCVILLPFILSTAYWIIQFAEQMVRINTFFVHSNERHSRNITYFSTLFNAIILLNYVISDCIVVWRAYALCREDYGKVLYLPILLLSLTGISVLTTIGLRIGTFFTTAGPGADRKHSIIRAIDVFQVSNLVWSLLTNITATCIVSHKAWHHRKAIRSGLDGDDISRGTKTEKIMTLLIESGFLYCISGATILIATVIKLPFGTLGDLFTPTNLQFAGIYPAIVIILVALQRTLDNGSYWQTTVPARPSMYSRVTHNSSPAGYSETLRISTASSRLGHSRMPSSYSSVSDLDLKKEEVMAVA